MAEKPWVLVVSHVWPVPGVSGQEKRVYYVLKALRESYNVSFLTYATPEKKIRHEKELRDLCDETVVLTSRYNAHLLSRLVFKGLGEVYTRLSGLKFSNFIIGHVEFTKSRVAKAVKKRTYKAVIFEYWHAHALTEMNLFNGTTMILDMHNILWQTYETQQVRSGDRSQGAFLRYKSFEEATWRKFDYVLSINREEDSYVKGQLGQEKVWYVPMGINLKDWPEVKNPENKVPRIAWYGSLATRHNQRDVMRVYKEVMPALWNKAPEIQFWIIGSHPPEKIIELGKNDSRVTVTGFLKDIAKVLGSMDLVLCPWEGTYGFRSRLVEIMATGTPIVTTEDAAYGMDFEHGEGILFKNDLKDWPNLTLELLNSSEKRQELRSKARQTIETLYSLEATYHQLPRMINAIKEQRHSENSGI